MGAFPITVRQLLVASLLTGLTTAGLPPCLLAAGNCPSAAPSDGAKTCCCKGKCGGHCRMACCQSPAPTQDRAPAPTKLSDDASVTWGLAASVAALLDAATAADFRHGISRHGAWIATPDSLIALSVRFNV
ncbi:MAG: hypothetical protein WD971_05175 [Pirellulales bacterium]